ncbi:MAG: hypothetical protein HZB76_02865 [Chlamydiae bacterium]|nr:hypothetical protein [Chlamydiota bacterium]
MAASGVAVGRILTYGVKAYQSGGEIYYARGHNTTQMKAKMYYEICIVLIQVCAEYVKTENKIWCKVVEKIMSACIPLVDFCAYKSLPEYLKRPEMKAFLESGASGEIGAYRAYCEQRLFQNQLALNTKTEDASQGIPVPACEVAPDGTADCTTTDISTDREDLQKQSSELKKMATIASIVEILINLGLVTLILNKVYGLIVRIPVRIPYINLDEIPPSLRADVVLSTYKCHLSGLPIRHIRIDPVTTLRYEKRAIEQYISDFQHAPGQPNRPMRIQDLRESPHIQTVIDDRLRERDVKFNQLAAAVALEH